MRGTDKFLSIVLVLCVLVTLGGCGSERYVQDVRCARIADAMEDAIGDEYGELEAGYMEYYFRDADGYDDVCFRYSVDGEDIGELGVFCASDEESAEALLQLCRDYVDEIRRDSRAFVSSYAPYELEKLDGAEARRFGRYVIYAVLDAATAQRAFEEAERVLIGE